MVPFEIYQLGMLPMSRIANQQTLDTALDSFKIVGNSLNHMSSGDYGITPLSDCTFPKCKSRKCRGHFGRFELKFGIPMPVHIAHIRNILSFFCVHCDSLVWNHKTTCHKKRPTVSYLNGRFLWSYKDSHGRATKPTSITFEKQVEIIEILSNDTCRNMLKYKDIGSHKPCLADCFSEFILVPPNYIRQSGIGENNEVSPNFITQLLNKAISAGKKLNQLVDDAVENNDAELAVAIHNVFAPLRVAQLKVPIAEYNEVTGGLFKGGVTIPQHDDFVPIFAQLGGKTGLVRDRMLAKRVNFSGRAVISPAPSARPDEIYLPWFWKGQMTPDGVCITEGVYFLINRAPSLKRTNILAFRVRFWHFNTIGLNPIYTSGYGADFDGDAVNGFFIKTPEAIAECEMLMSPTNNIIASGGKVEMRPIQDSVSGMFVALSIDEKLPFAVLEAIFEHDAVFAPRETIGAFLKRCKLQDDVEFIDARIAVSAAFPSQFSSKGEIKMGIIEHGVVFKKSDLSGLIKKILLTRNRIACGRFIDVFTRAIAIINQMIGISVTYNDMCPDPEFIAQVEHDSDAKFRDIIDEHDPAMAFVKASNIVNAAHLAGREVANKKYNGLLALIDSGAKGEALHFYQTYCMLGMQYVDGSPPEPLSNAERVTVHSNHKPSDILSKGIVNARFSKGMNPLQTQFHCAATRTGTANSSKSISADGASGRDLGKVGENAKVHDRHGSIIRYGTIVSTNIHGFNLADNKQYYQMLEDPELCDQYVERCVAEAAKNSPPTRTKNMPKTTSKSKKKSG